MLQNEEPMHHAEFILLLGSSACFFTQKNSLFLGDPAIWSLGHGISLCAILAKKRQEVEALSYYSLWLPVRFSPRSLCVHSLVSTVALTVTDKGLFPSITVCGSLYFDMPFQFYFKMNLHTLLLLENKSVITI